MHQEKQEELYEVKYTLKMQDPTPEPADAGLESFGDDGNGDIDLGDDAGSDDKPFDDEPFEAGVEADEESEPKKYIQQLAGKLGNSLRKYNKDLGEPDFETEKFAVNSVISATHTSEMDEEDQKDIIKKVKTSGAGEDDINVDVNVDKGGDDVENVDVATDGSDDEIDLDVEEGIIEDDFDINEKNSNLVENITPSQMETILRKKIAEMTEVEEPAVAPVIKPSKPAVDPKIAPSRRSKPFKVPVIKPGESPAPKATK